MKRARVGAIGARPNAFNTTRYSEKLFERSGISVSTLDLSEVLEGARRLEDQDPRVAQKLAFRCSERRTALGFHRVEHTSDFFCRVGDHGHIK